MSFAQTSAPAVTSFAGNPTDHAATLPAAVDAGDLLLLHFRLEDQSGVASEPSGWTQLRLTRNSSHLYAVYAKVADGSEGGGTANLVSSSGTNGCAQCYRVTDWYGDLSGVEYPGSFAFNSTPDVAPDPPSLTASWGAEDNLWFALSGAHDDDAAYTAAPANYTGLVSTVSGGGGNDGGSLGSARRELAAATENPGAFTLAASQFWNAFTLVVRPGAPSASRRQLTLLGAG